MLPLSEISEWPMVLNPSVRVLWRGDDAVQLELGQRALIVDGLPGTTLGELAGDGHRPSGELAGALNILAAAGFLWRRVAADPAPPPVRLAGELAALRTRQGSRADAVLAQRGTAAIVVHGTGRLAVGVASALAAAGVGRVSLHDSGDVHRYDCAPGGLLVTDEGRRFKEAASDAIHRAAPEADTSPLAPGERPDLVLLTDPAPIEAELRQSLHARGCAQLAARVEGDYAVIGPLVLPGLTSCLHCLDLHRLDRDPAWSALAVQLSTARRHATPSDVCLTALTVSVTALQALAHLDGDEPATLAGTLELHLPDWRLRRRSWGAHPGCECGASNAASDL